MKNYFFNFCEKFIAGAYSIKIGKELYTGMPRIFPIFLVAFLISLIGERNDIKSLYYFGFFLILVGIFGFFYYNIFPKRVKK